MQNNRQQHYNKEMPLPIILLPLYISRNVQNHSTGSLLPLQHPLFVTVQCILRQDLSVIRINCVVSFFDDRHKSPPCFFGCIGKNAYPIRRHKANSQAMNFLVLLSRINVIGVVAKAACL